MPRSELCEIMDVVYYIIERYSRARRDVAFLVYPHRNNVNICISASDFIS